MNSRRLAVIVSALLILLCGSAHAMGAKTSRERIFILSAEIGPGVLVSERDLLARIRQELPLDFFQKYNIEYEDLFGYLEVQKWNPGKKLDVFQWEFVQQVLSAKQMKWMLTFSLSYAPTGQQDGRLLLSGRLYDLDAMMCLLLEAKAQREKQSVQLNNCKNKNQPWEPSKEASVDLKHFNDLRNGLRSLFEKLFHIPAIEYLASENYFHPDEPLRVNFTLSLNSTIFLDEWKHTWGPKSDPLDAKQNALDSKSTLIPFEVQANVIELYNESIKECADLGRFSDYLRYSKGNKSNSKTKKSDIVGIQRAWARIYKSDERSKAADGEGYIQITPPLLDANYLLATRFLTQVRRSDGTTEIIPSFTQLKCIYVREPLNFVRLEVGINAYSTDILSDQRPNHSRARLPGFGVAIGIERTLMTLTGESVWPNLRGALLINLSSIDHGDALNCNANDSSSCDDAQKISSDSVNYFIQGRLSSELYRFRVGRLRIGLPITFGFGIGAANHILRIGEETYKIWSGVTVPSAELGFRLINQRVYEVDLSFTWEFYANFKKDPFSIEYIKNEDSYQTVWFRFSVNRHFRSKRPG